MQPTDPVDRAHLTGVSRPTPPIHRYLPSPDLVEVVRRYWIPVWSVVSPQRQTTLQYPVALIVISNTYARLYGVSRGASTVTLEGDGYAVGVMLTPAVGHLLLGQSMSECVDAHLDLDRVPRLAGLPDPVRRIMSPDPSSPEAHAAAISLVEDALCDLLPIDEEGLLVNRIVAWVEDHPGVRRVTEIADRFGLGERSLQRLLLRRVGLSPKWLIQRRRLHAAVEAIKSGRGSLADVAADLGYSDQAHFTRDFRAVTGRTPGDYAADQPHR